MWRYLYISALLVMGIWCGSSRAAASSGTQEALAKELDGGQKLLVIRAQMTEPEQLVPLLSARWRNVKKKAYFLSAILRTSTGQDIPLASRIEIEAVEDPDAESFTVLTAVVDDGEAVIAFGAGSRLCLWRIALASFWDDQIMQLDGWQISARGGPITPSSVAASVVRLPDRRWQVSVVDLKVKSREPAVFEQTPDGSRMALVSTPRKRGPDGKK